MTNVIDDTSMVPVVTQLHNELEDSFIPQGSQDQFNDGNGNCNRVTIISSYFTNFMQQKYTVQQSNVIKTLVDPDNLSSIDDPYVALIPQTPEQYYMEFSNILVEDLEHISNPTQIPLL